MNHKEDFSHMNMAPTASGEHRSTASRSSIAPSEINSMLGMPPSSNVKVIARFRPENEIEKSNDSSCVVEFLSEDSCQVETRDFSGSFTFDRVFNTESKQEEVFDYSLRQTVDDLMKGYNGTVLAYGQTGSGKSYTMMGSSIDDPVSRGAIPRIVDMIFDMIIESSSDIEYTVRVSYMEIYMERIKDLLNPRNENLPIHEDKIRGVYVKGLTEEYVASAEEVYDVMRQGGKARAVASTNMNQESSRSHSIFCIVVTQKNTITGAQKSGQLFLVDLAGSEKVGKTGASGQTLEEAKKINKSLSALGLVINSLTDGKSLHVPYRDSKLTRILQESLGGNSRTSLIVNCSPSSYNDAETLSTLRFGVRAKNIKNKAKINTELSPLELRQLLKKSQKQLDSRIEYSNKLEGELQLWRNGEPPAKEAWLPFGEIKPSSSHAASKSVSSIASRSGSSLSSRPETPTHLRTGSKSHVRKGSIQESILETDSIDTYLRRENELQDQISEKEALISKQEQLLSELRTQAKKAESQATEFKLTIDNLLYEKKETDIKSASVLEDNAQLTKQLQEAKERILALEAAAAVAAETKEAETDRATYEQQKKKKMSEIFGNLYQPDDGTDKKHTTTALEEAISALESVKLEDDQFDEEISTAKEKLNKALDSVNSYKTSASAIDTLLKSQDMKFRAYIESIEDENKSDVEAAFEAKMNANEETASALLAEISRLEAENHKLQDKLEASKAVPNLKALEQSSDGKEETTVPLSVIQAKEQRVFEAEEKIQSMQAHISQFEAMKNALMKDLQDRCERVVELEISLDKSREQYNAAIRDGNSKQQQKKMGLLQRNLEQLTTVQRQLVEQNAVLKKDVDMAHKILEARNDRIQNLEISLRESQVRLGQESEIFETKLTYLKDRLNDVKRGGITSPSALSIPSSPVSSYSPSLQRSPSRPSSPSKSGRTSPGKAMLNSIASSFPSIASIGAGGKVAHYPDLTPQPYVSHTKIVKPLRGGNGAPTLELQEQAPLSPRKEGLWGKFNSMVNNMNSSSSSSSS